MGVTSAGDCEPEHNWAVEPIHSQPFIYEDDIRAAEVSLFHLCTWVKQESEITFIWVIVVVQKVALILFKELNQLPKLIIL